MIKVLMLIFGLLLSSIANAYVLGLDYSAFTVSKIMCNRDYLIPELGCKDWRGVVALDTDFGTNSYQGFRLVMRNTVHGEGNESKFQTVGWKYEAAIVATQLGLELGWSHHSRHSLDQSTPLIVNQNKDLINKFPIYDAIFLRLVFTGDKR